MNDRIRTDGGKADRPSGSRSRIVDQHQRSVYLAGNKAGARRYHHSRQCAGRDPMRTSEANAEALGFSACPTCTEEVDG